MPRLITIDVDLLSDETRNRVLAERLLAMMKESYVMNSKEAGEIYGWNPGYVVHLLKTGHLKACRRRHRHGDHVITHAAIRAYMSKRYRFADYVKPTIAKAAQLALKRRYACIRRRRQFSYEEAAKTAGCTVRTLQRALANRELSNVVVNGQKCISQTMLWQWMQRRTRKGRGEIKS